MAETIFPEMRKDPTSGHWSVVTKKDKDNEEEKTDQYKPPESYLKGSRLLFESEVCPFSQSYSGGRRQDKDPILGLRWKGDEVEILWHENLEKRKKLWDSADWEIMMVEHDYAQVNRHISPDLFGDGPFVSLAGYGIHDMIIEDPTEEHKPLGVMPWKRTMLLFLAVLYRLKGDLGLKHNVPCFPKVNPDMFTPLIATEGIRHISFFHNHLREAGASEEHPHSQIIASPIIPTDVSAELDYLRKRYNEPPGRCIYCQVIETEKNLRERVRVLFENDSFLAVHPYAPMYPFEIWILPKKHSPSYVDLIPEDYSPENPNPLKDLARIVNDVIGRLYVSLRNPGYNLILKTAPIPRAGERDYEFHWHIRVEPRGLYKHAGFEIGTGIFSCETPPAEAVEFLQKWGVLTKDEDVDTKGFLHWYIKKVSDIESKKNGPVSEDDIITVREASHLLEILPDKGMNIQGGLELKNRIEEIKVKYPQIDRSNYQQFFPPEPRQRINILPKEFEETDGPHYRSDPSTERWVLVPSKKRRKKAKYHADTVEKWRKNEAEHLHTEKEKKSKKINPIKKKIMELKSKIETIEKEIAKEKKRR